MQHVWKILLALLAGLLVLIGLGGPGSKKKTPPPATTAAAATATDPPPVQTRQTLRKTTQNVMPLEQALAEGGVRANMSIQGQGLEVAADAYRTSVGKLSVMAVEHKMRLFEAENDRKPENHAEFMERIIEKGKPDGIALPMLPYYQEYAYDPEAKELVVIEFPKKKEQRQRETTGASGL